MFLNASWPPLDDCDLYKAHSKTDTRIVHATISGDPPICNGRNLISFPRLPWASFPGCSWVLPQAFPGASLDNYRTHSASFLGFLSARLAPCLGSSFPAPPPRVIPFLGLPWAFPDSSLGLPCALLGLSPASSRDPPWNHFEHSLGHYFANHGRKLGSQQKVSTRIRFNELGGLLFDN